jgi:hypothetical protein
MCGKISNHNKRIRDENFKLFLYGDFNHICQQHLCPSWSKEFDSSSNIFVCAGSNPVECNFFFLESCHRLLRPTMTAFCSPTLYILIILIYYCNWLCLEYTWGWDHRFVSFLATWRPTSKRSATMENTSCRAKNFKEQNLGFFLLEWTFRFIP